MLTCLFSWASMGTPTLSPTTATSCLIPTCGLWYGETIQLAVELLWNDKVLIASTVQRGEETEAQTQLQQCWSVRGGMGRYWGESEYEVLRICSIMQRNQRGSQRVVAVFQLRTAMVQGQTGTLSLDVRSSVDKGVSEDHRGDFTYNVLHPR